MPPPASPPDRPIPPWVPGVIVCGLALFCYWPALHGGLVWDDAAHVTRPDLQSPAGLARIWTDLHAVQQYYPVLHSAFWLEHRLWGDAVLGYHLVNVLLHAGSACLFALVLRRLWSRPDGATGGVRIPPGAEWLAAILFTVHPVAVESVAWISEQKNTLSLCFYLLSALAYLEFDTGRRRGTYALAFAIFLLALGTKSVTATLPAALLVVLWWKNGTLRWRHDVRPLLPWFAVALFAGTFTAWVERALIGAQGGTFDLTAGQRLLLAGRVIWFYLGKLAWPAELVFIYPRWDVPTAAPGWYGWLAATVAVTVGLWLWRRRSRGPLAAWLFFAGSLFPALGFFNVYPFLFSYVADHFQYLADLGVFAAAAAGLSRLLAGRIRTVRAGARLLTGATVVILAVASHRESRSYRDGETLYRTILERNPACWMAHNNLGTELAHSTGHLTEGIAHLREALRLRPDYPEALNNLGDALAAVPGGGPEVIGDFERALQLAPRFVEARLNLANAVARLPGRQPEAIALYQQVLQLDPGNPGAHFCFANLLAKLPGRSAEARAEYEEALRLQPDYAEAHDNLAGVLAVQPGGGPAALAHYREALRLRPELARSHFHFAIFLESRPGHEAEALQQYEEALRLQPDYAEAHNNLGVFFARTGRLDEARRQWRRALELKPDFADPRRNLERLDQMKSK